MKKRADEPVFADEHTFCCGGKKCPDAKLSADGSVTLHDAGETIRFTADQAAELREWLQSKGF